MKPTRITYDLSESLSLIVDNRDQKLLLSESSETTIANVISLTFEEGRQLINALQDNLSEPKIGGFITVPGVDPVPTGPANPEPLPRPNLDNVPQDIRSTILAAQAISDLFVVEKGGKFLPRKSSGDMDGCTVDIDSALFFQDSVVAAKTAASLGANVRRAADVMYYRICVRLPDGAVRFWQGNARPLSDHVNNSHTVMGEDNAIATLEAVRVPDAHKVFLMPVSIGGKV
jgi:hypothetical protein